MTGAITSNIDVAQVVLYAFWLFFAGLIFYLRREDKREGYPLENDRSGRVQVVGFPGMPPAKTFLLPHGGTQTAPRDGADRRPVAAVPSAPWPGAPLVPTGNAMLDAVGPASYAERVDAPELSVDGHPSIVPMRKAPETSIAEGDPDPRGMTVIAADDAVAGTVRDAWVDLTEPQIRYLEVEIAGGRTALLPIYFARVNGGRRTVKVRALLAEQFAGIPALRNPDLVTKREEDRITAYFAGGTLYATPDRQEPLL